MDTPVILAARRSQLFLCMSKHINVNPNFYKVGGREHAEGHGEATAHGEQTGQHKRNERRSRRAQGREGDRNFIPGAAPVGQKTKR